MDSLDPMSEQRRGARAVSRAVVGDVLVRQLSSWQAETGRAQVTVVDLGGGTGGLAVKLAAHDFNVVVVDPSPNALAALDHRAAERGVADRVRGVLGDADSLSEVAGRAGADAIVCHQVLDQVPSPVDTLQSVRSALAPDGVFSLLVDQRYQSVAQQVAKGDIVQAIATWEDPNRFDPNRIGDLLRATGFHTREMHGIGLLANQVSGDLGPGLSGVDGLYELELTLSREPSLWAAAASLLVFAGR